MHSLLALFAALLICLSGLSTPEVPEADDPAAQLAKAQHEPGKDDDRDEEDSVRVDVDQRPLAAAGRPVAAASEPWALVEAPPVPLFRPPIG